MSTLKNTLNLVQQHWQKYSPCGPVVQLEEFWLSNHCRYLHCCCCYWSFYGGCYVIPSFIFWQLPPACFASICCSNCPPSIHPQMDKYVFYSTQTQKKMKNNKFTDISQISNSCFVIQEPPFFIVSKASINTWQLSIYGCPCVNRTSPSPVGVAYSLTFQSSLILLFANNAGLIRFMFIWI